MFRTVRRALRLGHGRRKRAREREDAHKQHQTQGAVPLSPPATSRFVLTRILGNDIAGRHGTGQTERNLRFILENEPDLPRCEKRFVLNRLSDPSQEAALADLLAAAGHAPLRLPFDAEEFAALEPEDLSRHHHTLARKRDRDPLIELRYLQARYRPHNRYLMNNNGARNAALDDGRGRADWVLPWDGNCFLTEAAWAAILASVDAHASLPYHIVPMARTADNADLLRPGPPPEARDEPQVIFHRSARGRFDDRFVYGRRPKVELLMRLGVEGDWYGWGNDPWELHPEAGDIERYLYNAPCGWVSRLASGKAAQEVGEGAQVSRYEARGRGIVDAIERHLPADRHIVPPDRRG